MSPFERLQLDVMQCLLSHEEMQHVNVTLVRPRSAAEAAGIQTGLEKALAGLVERNGKKGVACIVGMPVFDGVKGNVRALRGKMTLALDFIENIILNDTGASCEEHAWEGARLLQHMSFAPWSPLVSEPQMMTPRPEAVLNKQVIYRVEFAVEISAEVKGKVMTPEVSVSGGGVILSCGTEGAALWYTMDESYPGPGNAAAVLYAAPLEPGAGAHTLRVAAFQAGLVGSDAVRVEIAVGP